MKNLLILVLGFLPVAVFSQVSITTANYSQNFGTASIPAWTDNSTIPGWYLAAGGTFNYGGTQNITAAAPTNTGGFYTYQCNSDGNIKLGSRPSNTSGGTAGSGQSHIGLRLRNNTGSTIESITVTYTGYQLSLAQNGAGNTNSFTFSYQSAATVSSLTAGSWTSVAALNYNSPNDAAAGSNQVSGYPCTVSQTLSSCIAVSITDGNEIMLRWTDINNTNNDHHLAIDNISVLFHFDNACFLTLPVQWLAVDAREKDDFAFVEWETGSELNTSYFLVEGSDNGEDFRVFADKVAAGNDLNQYSVQEPNWNSGSVVRFYRVIAVDIDGIETSSAIVKLHNNKQYNGLIVYPNPSGGNFSVQIDDEFPVEFIEIYDATGKLVTSLSAFQKTHQFSGFAPGVYVIQLRTGDRVLHHKLVVQ
jgi:hypothetical protein